MDPNEAWNKLIEAQDNARECILKAREVSDGKLLTLQAELRQVSRTSRQHADDLFAALAREEELKENIEIANNSLQSRDAQLRQTETQLRIALERAGSSEQALRTTTGNERELKVKLQAAETRNAEFEKKAISQIRAAQLRATELETLVNKMGEELAVASAWKESVLNPDKLAELITKGLTEEGANEVGVDEMSVAVVAVSISGNTWKILRNNLKLIQDKLDIQEEQSQEKEIKTLKPEAKKKKSQNTSAQSQPVSAYSSSLSEIPSEPKSHHESKSGPSQDVGVASFISKSNIHLHNLSHSSRTHSADNNNDETASVASSLAIEETNARALKVLEVQDQLKKSLPDSTRAGRSAQGSGTPNSTTSSVNQFFAPPPSSAASYMSSSVTSAASSVVSMNVKGGDERDYKDANNDEFINEMEESLKSFEGLLPSHSKGDDVDDGKKVNTSGGNGESADGGGSSGNVPSNNDTASSTGTLRDRINAWKSRITTASGSTNKLLGGRYASPAPSGMDHWRKKNQTSNDAHALRRANSAPIERNANTQDNASTISSSSSKSNEVSAPIPPPRTILRKDGMLLSPNANSNNSNISSTSSVPAPERKLRHASSFNTFSSDRRTNESTSAESKPSIEASPTSMLTTKADRLNSPLRSPKLTQVDAAAPKINESSKVKLDEAFGEVSDRDISNQQGSMPPRRLGSATSNSNNNSNSSSSTSSTSEAPISISGASLLSPSKSSSNKVASNPPRSPARGRSKSPARPPSMAPPSNLINASTNRPPPPPPPSASSSSHKRSSSRDRSRRVSSHRPRSTSRGRRSPSPSFHNATGEAPPIPPPPRRSSDTPIDNSVATVSERVKKWREASDRKKEEGRKSATPPTRRRGSPSPQPTNARAASTPTNASSHSSQNNFAQTLRRATPVSNKATQDPQPPPFQSPLSPCKHVPDDSLSPIRDHMKKQPLEEESSPVQQQQQSRSVQGTSTGGTLLSPNQTDGSNMSWVENLTLGETLVNAEDIEDVQDEQDELLVVSPGTNAQSTSRYMNHRQQQKQNVLTSPSAYVNKKIQDRAPSPSPNWGQGKKEGKESQRGISTQQSSIISSPTASTSTQSQKVSPSSRGYEKAPFINPYSDVHADALASSSSGNKSSPTHKASSPLLLSHRATGQGQQRTSNKFDESYVESDFTRAIENLDDSLASFKSFENNEDEDALEVTPSGRLSRKSSMRNSFDNIMSGSYQVKKADGGYFY